ncbi:MAG: hypothetical protein H9855_06890 [Candidatus Acinetobacter avistercoris]|uniref:hypothetical protein n=1 Tax=Acinetobacter sp. KS-LM10 TaxID=3120518 RepID=UPI001F9FBC87|nr:hypothetical protein [Candidatus Acinetobacter avistercoris]
MNQIFSENKVKWISIVWVVLVFVLILFKWNKLPLLELNEIGDFLAGVFAPLGFFWLVAGFYQNSKALRMQADELQKSTEAMNFQIEEMKESVDQQKIMAELYRLEVEERHHSVMPILRVSAELNIHNFGGIIHFSIKNQSNNEARNITIQNNRSDKEDDDSQTFEILLNGKSRVVKNALTENEIALYEQNTPFKRIILLSYESILGRKFHAEYLLEIGKTIHPTHQRIMRVK